MNIGDRLPNGAIVMEFTPQVILAKGEKGVSLRGSPPIEYVTWRWDGTNPASTVWGHYFSGLAAAAGDFEARVQREEGRHASG